MNPWLKALAGLTLAGGMALLAACGGGDSDPPTAAQSLATEPRFSTLNAAIDAAGLRATLDGAGPFTVFAPTDAAFAALLTELGLTRDQLLADRALLTAVLTYHVLPARVERAAIPAGRAITTVQGGVFKITANGPALTITDGRNRAVPISSTDLSVRNGVIHTVDRVLLPPNRDLVQTAQALPGFGTLVQAVLAANLQGALAQPGPLTVFAPTDAAFGALLAELNVTAEALLADTALLTRVLTYHVVPGRVLAADIVPGAPVTTLQGGRFTVGADLAITDGQGRRARITGTDVLTTNGVVHVIDRVILPPAN